MKASSYRISFYVLSAFVVVAIFFCYRLITSSRSGDASATLPQQLVVAITQIAPHPSLDAIHRGIVDELEAQKIPNLKIMFQNAQGTIATATQIAQKFVSLHPTVIVPITTPSAQSSYNAARLHNIPVVFAAVSDPVAAKLIPTFAESGEGITGVYDQAPFAQQAELIAALVPKKSLNEKSPPRNVGIIYNPGETNSVSTVTAITRELALYDISATTAAALSTATVAVATQSLLGKVDALYLPNDNTVIAALDALLTISQKEKIPVFSSDPESVERGCLATIAPDQYQVGRQTGRMVVALLNGAALSSIAPEKAAKLRFVINHKTAELLGISIPQELIDMADRINRQ